MFNLIVLNYIYPLALASFPLHYNIDSSGALEAMVVDAGEKLYWRDNRPSGPPMVARYSALFVGKTNSLVWI